MAKNPILNFYYGTGFFLTDISNSKFYFQLANKADSSTDPRYKLIQKLNSTQFAISTKEIPQELYKVARILTLKEDQLENPAIEAALLRGKKISDAVELHATKKLIALCKASLKNTTTIEEDKEALKNPSLSVRERNIITLKLYDKQIIEIALTKLQEQHEDLMEIIDEGKKKPVYTFYRETTE